MPSKNLIILDLLVLALYFVDSFGTQERLQKWTKGTLNFTLYKVKTIQVVIRLTPTPVHPTLCNVGLRGTETMKL